MDNNINQKSQPTEPSTSKAAIYCRVASRHPSDAETTYIQLEKLRNFATKQGFKECMEYMDNGYSGSNLNRPAFAQMEADINSGKIDTVIVSCINRIARDVFLLGEWIGDSKAKGVLLIAADCSHEPPPFVLELSELMKVKNKVK